MVIVNKNKKAAAVAQSVNNQDEVSSLKVETDGVQDLDEADEVEVGRAAGEPYYEEADDPTETYADGRYDNQYDEGDEEEEAEDEEEEAEAEEYEAEAEEYEAEAEEYEAEAEEYEAEAEEYEAEADEDEDEAEADEEEAEADEEEAEAEEYEAEAEEYEAEAEEYEAEADEDEDEDEAEADEEEAEAEEYEAEAEEYEAEADEDEDEAEADEEEAEAEEYEAEADEEEVEADQYDAEEYEEPEADEEAAEEWEVEEEEIEAEVYGEEEAQEYEEEEAQEYEEEEAQEYEEEAQEYEEEAQEYEEEEAQEYEEEEEEEEYAIEAGTVAGEAAAADSPLQSAPLVVKFNDSEKKRIVMSQLSSVIDVRAEQDEDPLSGVTQAVHRINRARLCHVGCKPVTCHDEYCLAAQKLAQRFADYEAEHGLNSRLQVELQSYSAVLRMDDDGDQPMLILDEEEDGNETVGLVVSRIEFEDFDRLPVDSVNMWYKIETQVDFLVMSQDPELRLRGFQYIQLLDCRSKRVGWAAVPLGSDPSYGVAYAVAVFEHAALDDEDPLSKVPRKVDATTFE